jgi:hypothetical protein
MGFPRFAVRRDVGVDIISDFALKFPMGVFIVRTHSSCEPERVCKWNVDMCGHVCYDAAWEGVWMNCRNERAHKFNRQVIQISILTFWSMT